MSDFLTRSQFRLSETVNARFLAAGRSPSLLFVHWDWSGSTLQTLESVDEAVGKADRWGWGQWWGNPAQTSKGYYVRTASTYFSDPINWNWKSSWMTGTRPNGMWWQGLTRHGVCAFPESYGMTGMNIFIMNDKGEVYQKDGFFEMDPEGPWFPFWGYDYQFEGNMKSYDWVSVQ